MTTAIVSGMGFADMMAVNTTLPVMQIELGIDVTNAFWIAEIYLLFVASLMMMGGALGDRYGHRRVLRFGILAFAASSLLCAASTSGSMLVFGRATQGLAAALTMPSTCPVERLLSAEPSGPGYRHLDGHLLYDDSAGAAGGRGCR